MTTRPALLLFDIDGTLLVRAADAHRDALYAALREVYGLPDPAAAHVEVAGRTDLEIARHILIELGVSARRIDDRLEDLRAVAVERYAELCPDSLADHVAPGMPGLLEELSARDDVRLSLVTGNLEPIARLKLRRAGLAAFFPGGQGGFGSDHEDRTELPAIARTRAGRDGSPHPRERTWVIGDTPRDVACAHADGVRCVAVTTGPFPAEALREADALASGAVELRSILEAELAR
jgi:phosphoglycolate phosphatase-like HAD superfamily hydrolase